MIRKLTVEGVTVFPCQVSFSFVPGINVIAGGNDSGKSHLMKLCYAIAKWGGGSARRELPQTWAEEKRLRRDLLRVFGAHGLTGLTARSRGNGKAFVRAALEGEKAPLGTADLAFSFEAGQEEEGLHIQTLPQRFLHENAIFISPREALSIFPCYLQAGKRYPDLLDAVSWDLCRALEEEPGDVKLNEGLRHAVRQIETLLSGKLQRANGRFFLQRVGQEPMELSLVAEGFKRIGALGLLLGNGMVRPGTSLFWDEPEMNLNTTHLPLLVSVLLGLCRAGVQLMLTTHSLFLLRELVSQLADKRNARLPRRFFGLQTPVSHAEGAVCSAGETLNEISPIASLEAEMEQADRYLRMPDF